MTAATDPNQPTSATDREIDAAVEALRAGGLVVFPTETVYGLGALASSDDGYAALRRAKERPDVQPFTVHVADARTALEYVQNSHPFVVRVVRRLFPGAVTLVVDVPDTEIAARLASMGLPEDAGPRLFHQNTLGLRCPDHPVAQALLERAARPVLATSANRRGVAPPTDVESARQAVEGLDVAAILDGGPARYAKPSTIIHIRTANAPYPSIKVLREGVLAERMVRRRLQWTLLLVCSGNTCRSPMAELLARDMLVKRWGGGEAGLEEMGIRVVSAGAATVSGLPASEHAVQAMQRRGLDLASHQSRSLTVDLVRDADRILCMSESHRRAVLRLDPAAKDRTTLLDPSGDVNDPFGGILDDYLKCAAQIEQALNARMRELEP